MTNKNDNFVLEENEHDVVDKVYDNIFPRKPQSEWVKLLKNKAGEEWGTSCTEHFAWQAAEYIQELEEKLKKYESNRETTPIDRNYKGFQDDRT